MKPFLFDMKCSSHTLEKDGKNITHISNEPIYPYMTFGIGDEVDLEGSMLRGGSEEGVFLAFFRGVL
jgi:hypothetical protein